MSIERSNEQTWEIGHGITITVRGDFRTMRNVLVKVEFEDSDHENNSYIIPINEKDLKGVRPEELKSVILGHLISYFEALKLSPNTGRDFVNSNIFFKTLKEDPSLKKEFVDEWKRDSDLYYENQVNQFDKEVKKIETELKKMGFNVELKPDHTFVFHFASRSKPAEVKISNFGCHSNQNCIFMETSITQFYTIDDVLDQLESQLKPVEGRRYMKSFLNTWEEFRNIRYKDGKITVEEKKDLSH